MSRIYDSVVNPCELTVPINCAIIIIVVKKTAKQNVRHKARKLVSRMPKVVIVLLVVILLALVAVGSYLFLSGKISGGEQQIAAGQQKLDKEQPMLDEGKVKLEDAKQELSAGKKKYGDATGGWFLVWVDKLLKGGKGFRDAKEQITAGDKSVAKGEKEVTVGEARLDVGKSELREGRDQLRMAKDIHIACAIAAVCFVSLAIVLGIRWRRSVARLFRHKGSQAR